MANDMLVRVEVWPVAADETGIWLVSGDDALRSHNVASDSEPHTVAEDLVTPLGLPALLHSTSWRVDGPAVIVTYLAVMVPGDLVRGVYPHAEPVGVPLQEAVGRPFTHGPVDPPTPRFIDVLMHGIRHLAFLVDNDATVSAALDGDWRRHLAALEPALAVMYQGRHAA
jgi:hypothetical protein